MKIIILAYIFGLINAEFFIYEKLDRKLLENAREVGVKAKIAYMKGPDSVADAKLRYNLYLDGLEQCDSLGSEQLFKVVKHINETANATAAAEFEKIGLKPFQSQFMTLKVDVMKEVIDMACGKHEQQLQCGAEYEGREVIERRIQDLKTIGNHRWMFEHECNNESYSPNIYPCVGKNLENIRHECGKGMDTYWNLRENSNHKIVHLYDILVQTLVSHSKIALDNETRRKQEEFQNTVEEIIKLEGQKCHKFKEIRPCVLSVLTKKCGEETTIAINNSISVGYMVTERNERMGLDFKTFNIPTHLECLDL